MNAAAFIQDIKEHPIDYLAMLLAMIGAYLTPSPVALERATGFFIWIFSNGWLLYGFYINKNHAYIMLFVFYEVMNLRGVMNNI